MPAKVAFIGLGAIGEPMAASLLKKGFALTVVKHRRPEPAERLRSLGATLVATPAEAIKGAEMAFLSLPTSREVEEVVLGAHGLIAGAAPGTVIVDCSTSRPESTRRLHALLKARAIDMIDAPVTRGVQGARQGTLAFFLGGEQSVIDKVQTALQAMGDTFIHFGAVGNAHTAKVISNVLSYGTVALINEAMMLGAGAELDLNILHHALTEAAPSKALAAFGPRIVARINASKDESERRALTVGHVCQDLLLAQELATTFRAPIFLLAAAQEVYRLANARGFSDFDMSSIADMWRSPAARKELAADNKSKSNLRNQ